MDGVGWDEMEWNEMEWNEMEWSWNGRMEPQLAFRVMVVVEA
jgi:hypothetical protein